MSLWATKEMVQGIVYFKVTDRKCGIFHCMVYKLLQGMLPVELQHTSCDAVRESSFCLSVTYAQETTP
ncbi:hypothetical protein Y032_0301g1844 [Ancylostoma ceylanicum]|uniref:Uncharacterized protein n=1 Tax=Ancylostoma ceylanicum TaxID=53326 RepID=A0A016S4M7_9BILA|nr:hypothetical protein Y032_0301g1844 [Ancylostoma ceylanicum]